MSGKFEENRKAENAASSYLYDRGKKGKRIVGGHKSKIIKTCNFQNKIVLYIFKAIKSLDIYFIIYVEGVRNRL